MLHQSFLDHASPPYVLVACASEENALQHETLVRTEQVRSPSTLGIASSEIRREVVHRLVAEATSSYRHRDSEHVLYSGPCISADPSLSFYFYKNMKD